MNVGINVLSHKIIYNDVLQQVTELLEYLYYHDLENVLVQIHALINEYQLSKTNQQGYLKLREEYNKNAEPITLYVLICYSFNNQIRFNSKQEYNMPFGKDRSSFNPTLEKRFIQFVEELQSKDCKFSCSSFESYPYRLLDTNDFVYCDPPYLNSTATYNENNGWTENNEESLLRFLSELDSRGVRWALSNNLKLPNEKLKVWMQDYNVSYLNANYGNCSYHKKDKGHDAEVLIINY